MSFELLSPRLVLASLTGDQLVDLSKTYLDDRMDEYHLLFESYRDIGSPGNHFHARAFIPNEGASVTINGSATEQTFGGSATSMHYGYQPDGNGFGGVYLQNGVLEPGAQAPVTNFGEYPNAGVDLSGATKLQMQIRGAQGGEVIEIFHGGIGRNALTGAPETPFPDSSVRVPSAGTKITLSSDWQHYEIPLAGHDLSYSLGWGWVASAADNPTGVDFFIDNAAYVLSPDAQTQRLNEPRFVKSFETLPLQPDLTDSDSDGDIDIVLRNAASTYDNAVLVLAYIAEGSKDSLHRATLIGEAFIRAIENDRFFNNGAIRKFVAAGDIALPPGWLPNGRSATVPIPGFYAEEPQVFYEIEQDAVDLGNTAWAMNALFLGLYRRTGETRWLDAATTIGDFILTLRQDTGTYQGFLGGIIDPEGDTPTFREYASSEHQLDVAVVARLMYQATAEPKWLDVEQHARTFIDAMFDAESGCNFTGTIDPETRNEGSDGQPLIPLDPQSWFVLAFPEETQERLGQTIQCVETNLQLVDEATGLTGFDFNNDLDGIWFEGTAQMTLAYQVAGMEVEAALINEQLLLAQDIPEYGGDGALTAATVDGLTTGFDFKYFQRNHVAAVAWQMMALLGVNPYYQNYVTLPYQNHHDPFDVNRDHVVSPKDALLVISQLNATGARSLQLPHTASIPSEYWDASGDDFLSPIDALLVIQRLNDAEAEGEGEAQVEESLSVELPLSRSFLGAAALTSNDSELDTRSRPMRVFGSQLMQLHDPLMSLYLPQDVNGASRTGHDLDRDRYFALHGQEDEEDMLDEEVWIDSRLTAFPKRG